MDVTPRFTFPDEWLTGWDGPAQSTVNGSAAAEAGASAPCVLPLSGAAAEFVAKLRSAMEGYETWGRDLMVRNPMESLLALVFGGAALYYLAERQRNEKVQTYWDALEYVSTSASVGYSNIFPSTPIGKIVATAAFLFGPTLTSRALDPPATEASAAAPQSSADSQALLAKLEQILSELKNLNSRSPS